MSIDTILTDIKLVVEGSNKHGPATGSFSEYVANVHPGTGNQISGWRFDDRLWPSDDNDYATNISALTNPDLSQVDSTNFQSGIGSGEDCKVEELVDVLYTGFIPNRFPEIFHGSWFEYDKEYYLYSDYIRTQYPIAANLTSGLSYIDMAEFPKEGVPILARTYIWDSTSEKHLVYTNYAKKVHLTGSKPTPTSERLSTWNDDNQTIIVGNIDSTQNEFTILYSFSPPRIVFNKNVVTAVGHHVTTSADLPALEVVGTSDGSDKVLFYTKYSPIEKTQAIEVYTYTTDITVYQAWTPRINTALTHSGHECLIDTDLGTVQFGAVGDGDAIPAANAHVLVRYSYTVDASYETPDTNFLTLASNRDADVNPISRTNYRGFITIARTENLPGIVTLTAGAPLISPDIYGPVDIGSVLLALTATVTTEEGARVEHAEVTFELLDSPIIGNFTNGGGNISTFTNGLGIATTYYDTPNSIDEVSEFLPIAQYATSGGNTILTTTAIKVSAIQRQVFLYSVWKDDPFQGIDIGDQTTLDAGLLTTELSDYYKSFFTAEGIFGPTGNDPMTGDPEGMLQTGASSWENRRRLLQGLMTPISYNRALRNGRKQIIATWDATALDPHYNEVGAFIPLQPTTIVNIGTPIQNAVHYNGIVLTAPGTGDLDGYLLISPTVISVRAAVYDAFLDKTIYSDTIQIQLQIPDALNGTVYISNVNLLPAAIVPYILNPGDNGKILPLGFKIRQTGVTFASAVQGVTYIDINEPAVITMTFNVDKLV